jgi:hydrogenase-4 component F
MVLLAFFIISALVSTSIVLFKSRTYAKIVTIGYAFIHIAFAGYCWINLDKTELSYFTYDSPGVLLLSVLSLLLIPTIYHGFIYTSANDTRKYTIYHTALVALIACMTGAYLANGMTVLWIFVEATTLSVAALVYHDRTEIALEATWKYVFICSVGIAIAYIGILFLSFIYGRGDVSVLSFSAISELISLANPLYLKIAFVFVVVGFSTKMGLFPMHTVTTDAHTVAPPPVSALISTTLMNVGFLAIFRVYSLFASTSILPFMNHMLILSGILSILVAAGYMLKAKHMKRMLAYSSLENMGLVAIALGIGGDGYYAAFLLLILHSLTKASLFYHMGQFSMVLRTYKLDNCGRYMKLYPAGGLILIIGMFCILAIPPSGMFISEVMLFKAMVIKGNWAVLIITALLLCCVIYALVVRIMHIVFSEPRNSNELLQPVRISPWEAVSQFVFLGIVIVICFYQPPFLSELINQSVSGLLN